MNHAILLKTWSIIIGVMEVLTGLIFILAPGSVLRLLKVEFPSQEALVFLSWIGVFIMAVGLSYGLALRHRARGETVWAFTSLVSIMIVVFLTWHILDETMRREWAVLVMIHATVALVQVSILRAKWWKDVHR
ncbi:MAG: hypothetical protein H8M99_07300 [Gloeobacteraceae cyanobacterium ES-bin-144]|nr:hypothetical protein [Verrucomicrobiales bacterium]